MTPSVNSNSDVKVTLGGQKQRNTTNIRQRTYCGHKLRTFPSTIRTHFTSISCLNSDAATNTETKIIPNYKEKIKKTTYEQLCFFLDKDFNEPQNFEKNQIFIS